MADPFIKEERSRIMSRIRAKETSLELNFLALLSAALYPKGYRYRKNYRPLIGKPDIVFVKQKVAVFLDGDFWHGYNFEKRKHRLPRVYWRAKIERNVQRDKEVSRMLRKAGWKVLRFWEHQIKKDPSTVILKIEKKLKSV